MCVLYYIYLILYYSIYIYTFQYHNTLHVLQNMFKYKYIGNE